MMQGILDLARFFALLFLTGLPVSVGVVVVAAFAVDRARKGAVRMAKEAGVDLVLKPDPGPSVTEIQGTVYCIGFIVVGAIIVVAAVLGISLPIEVSEDVENIIGTAFSGIFGVLLWALALWSPYYYIAERRRLKHDLEEAMSRKEP